MVSSKNITFRLMKEKLQEIYEGLKERLKSPFILTFIIVWCIHHWRLVFHVLTFDSTATQDSKFKYVNDYIKEHSVWLWEIFWWPVICTVLSFLGYLLAALIFESITELYDRWGRTAVLYVFNRNKTVKREELELVKTKLREVEKSYNELDKMYSELETELQEVEADLDNEVKNHDTLKSSNEKLLIELTEAKEKLKREDDYIYYKTRKSLYDLIEYFTNSGKVKTVGKEIKPQQLFFGIWNRREYNDNTLNQRTEHEITFRNDNGYGVQDEFLFTIQSIVHHTPGEIYTMIYKTANDLQVKELLFRVSKELIIGGIANENGKFVKLTEYIKLK